MTGFPTMRTAFRTTVSGGGKYEMVFRFPSMDDLHAADDEWRAALATPASDVAAVDVDDAQALAREFKRMQGLIYCPGVLRCAKCDFRLIKTTLTPAGAFANEEPDSCPNCNVPMWRVTWQDEAHEAYRVAESQMERALGAEKKLAHPLLAQSVDHVAGEALREKIARIIAAGNHGDPWWWKDAFDDGSDETAIRLRADDASVADDVLAALKGPAANELGFDPTAEVGDEVFPHDTIGSHFGNGGGLDPAAGDVGAVEYGDAAQDAVMRLLERGVATVNSDGYLVLAHPPHPAPVDPAETLAQRQAREVMRPQSGSALAQPPFGQVYGMATTPVDPVAGGEALREALENIAALRSPNNGDYVRIAEKALAALKGPAA